MLRVICGPSGYGKTYEIYKIIEEKLFDFEKKLFVIVPEQESVKAEKSVLEYFGNSINERLEILNFSRLANRVFREAGGITYKYADNGGKDLILSMIAEDAGEELSSFENSFEDENFISSVRCELDTLRLGGITSEKLKEISHDISQKEVNSSVLSEKLLQLSYICDLYEGELKHNGGTDVLDDLSRLAKTLEEYDFFENSCVFIDGFYDFTYPEYEIIKQMIKYSDDVYITLPLIENDTESVFIRSSDALKKLTDISEKADCDIKTVFLKEKRKNQAFPISFVAERITDGKDMSEFGEKISSGNAITFTECSSLFDECVYVAREIVKLVKSGTEFREIAVCAGDISGYGGMIEDVFEKYGIKFLFAEKEKLIDKPLASFIFSSLAVITHDFYLPTVRRYLESALLPIDRESRFLLTNYIKTWNIGSSLWKSENNWVMNPRGYTEKISEEEKEELETVNSARRAVYTPLSHLAEGLKGETVKEKITAVWNYLEETGIKETLIGRAQKNLEKGNFSSSRDEADIWNLTLSSLDLLCKTAGSRKVTTERFVKYMHIMFRDSDFGRIPSTVDEVEIGNIGFVRSSDIKHMFLIGFNEGIFPPVQEEKGIFTENEKRILERFSDCYKSNCNDMKLYGEIFNLLIAFSIPCDSLNFVYHTSSSESKDDRISFFAPIIMSYTDAEINIFEAETAPPVCRKELTERLLSYRNAENIDDILASVKKEDEDFYLKICNNLNIRNFCTENLSFENPEKIFSGKINMTQARLDSFSRCPFAYYSNYMLSLKKSKRAEFRVAEIGSLVHKVLEEVLSFLASENKKICDADSKTVERLARACANEYLKKAAPEISDTSRRFKYLVNRLVFFTVYIIENMREEFENSDFSPVLFEENMEEGGVLPPYEVSLPNGSSLIFYGCVDRVDLFEDDDGKKYLRVVDYKTKLGGKKFDLNDVINGINLQLLVYLFAIWQNGKKEDSYPAGIMYMPASLPSIRLDSKKVAKNEKDEREEKMKRSGLFLLDEKILNAMEHGVLGKVVPIKKNAKGGYNSSSSLATLEQFGALKRYTDKIFSNLASKLQKGCIEASPLEVDNTACCDWCDFKAFCRYEGRTRKYKKVSEPWSEIESVKD